MVALHAAREIQIAFSGLTVWFCIAPIMM